MLNYNTIKDITIKDITIKDITIKDITKNNMDLSGIKDLNLSIILERLNNTNILIKCILISLIFLYFFEDWNFQRILILLFAFIAIFLFFNRDLIVIKSSDNKNNGNNGNNSKGKNSKMNIKEVNRKLENISNNVPEKTKNIVPELKDVIKNMKIIIEYSHKMKNLAEEDERSYCKLTKELVKLTKEYVKQINVLITDIDKKNYPHLTYQKVRDCQKEIDIQVNSLHFKVGLDQYMELALLLNEYENTIELITTKIINYLNKNFADSPTASISPIQPINDPRGYDDAQDLSLHFMP